MAANYLSANERLEIVKEFGLLHTPILYESVTLTELGIKKLDDLLLFAEGPSLNATQREGVVFKSVDGSFSFKAISNKWLLKNE
jgi:ATP-dependent RNA circularization protein (DNA/RNA ligase family)